VYHIGLVDRILQITDAGIETQKNLSINEDYLLDHFPEYPVMPGVLMLEVMIESARWWVKKRCDFHVYQFETRNIRNAKFSNFLKAGEILRARVENTSFSSEKAVFSGVGCREEKIVLSAKFEINYKQFVGGEGTLETNQILDTERAEFKQLSRNMLSLNS
jgi:3-hydroxyacyl-[acyl-carrier-protein] dehydratase